MPCYIDAGAIFQTRNSIHRIRQVMDKYYPAFGGIARGVGNLYSGFAGRWKGIRQKRIMLAARTQLERILALILCLLPMCLSLKAKPHSP